MAFQENCCHPLQLSVRSLRADVCMDGSESTRKQCNEPRTMFDDQGCVLLPKDRDAVLTHICARAQCLCFFHLWQEYEQKSQYSWRNRCVSTFQEGALRTPTEDLDARLLKWIGRDTKVVALRLGAMGDQGNGAGAVARMPAQN